MKSTKSLFHLFYQLGTAFDLSKMFFAPNKMVQSALGSKRRKGGFYSDMKKFQKDLKKIIK